jgi:hypothetical protein
MSQHTWPHLKTYIRALLAEQLVFIR